MSPNTTYRQCSRVMLSTARSGRNVQAVLSLQGAGLPTGRSVQSAGLRHVFQGLTTCQAMHCGSITMLPTICAWCELMAMQEVVIVGGLEMQQQAKALARRPHVVVATPGRLKVCLCYIHTSCTQGCRAGLCQSLCSGHWVPPPPLRGAMCVCETVSV